MASHISTSGITESSVHVISSCMKGGRGGGGIRNSGGGPGPPQSSQSISGSNISQNERRQWVSVWDVSLSESSSERIFLGFLL